MNTRVVRQLVGISAVGVVLSAVGAIARYAEGEQQRFAAQEKREIEQRVEKYRGTYRVVNTGYRGFKDAQGKEGVDSAIAKAFLAVHVEEISVNAALRLYRDGTMSSFDFSTVLTDAYSRLVSFSLMLDRAEERMSAAIERAKKISASFDADHARRADEE